MDTEWSKTDLSKSEANASSEQGKFNGLTLFGAGSKHCCWCDRSGFDLRHGQIGRSVANDSPPPRRFLEAVLLIGSAALLTLV